MTFDFIIFAVTAILCTLFAVSLLQSGCGSCKRRTGEAHQSSYDIYHNMCLFACGMVHKYTEYG
jgi:uncharacterized protein YceK